MPPRHTAGSMHAHGPAAEKLAIVMVGLPARGKTYVARKIARYLAWLGYKTKWFNVGEYRRARAGAKQPAEFFDPANESSWDARLGFALAALDDMLDFLREGGEVGIYDAANTERSRRELVYERCRREGAQVVFIECICEDESVVDANVRETKLRSPDYVGVEPEEAVRDFLKRIDFYERTYEPIEDEDKSYVKLIDLGRQIVVNRVEGYLCSRLVFFLINLQPAQRRILLTRHGESQFNLEGRIGGDPGLTELGVAYARSLSAFVPQRLGTTEGMVVWTSTLARTTATATEMGVDHVTWRALDELDAGVCERLTYAEIKARMPEVADARAKDKFRYRYPQGESYADVIQRLEPLIIELERQRAPLLIIAHQAIIRALYGYLMGRPQEECPHIGVPLHTVIELVPTAYGYEERRFELDPKARV
jgi:broad specificity phosphatase PhoE/predicted kinase